MFKIELEFWTKMSRFWPAGGKNFPASGVKQKWETHRSDLRNHAARAADSAKNIVDHVFLKIIFIPGPENLYTVQVL